MPAYLGKPGALLPIPKVFEIEVTAARQSSEKKTIGGRVYEFRSPASRRSWSVNLRPNTAGNLSGIQSLLLGSKPPWVFVDSLAQVTNMLSPEQSILTPGTWAGSGVLEGGSTMAADGTFAVRTLLHATGGTMDFGYRDGSPDRPAVIPGVPTCWSVYVRGAGIIGVSFRDWAGQTISEQTAPYSAGTLSRVSIGRTPPTSAVSARVWVTGAQQAALPAFTWTEDVAAWGIGRGCNRVTVKDPGESVESASRATPQLRRASTSLSIQELG